MGNSCRSDAYSSTLFGQQCPQVLVLYWNCIGYAIQIHCDDAYNVFIPELCMS